MPYDPLSWLDEYALTEGPTDAQKSHGQTTELPGGATGGGSTPTEASSGGGGSYGYSSGGGGGGGGGGSTGLSEYIQDYRLKFFPGASPPADLLAKAKANNWSMAYFEQQVRLKDPKYYRSLEARQVLPIFNRQMKVLFPGLADKTRQGALMKSPFYKRIALWYLKNGVGLMGEAGAEMLYGKITGTKQWNRQNPNYRAYARNANANVQLESNPLVFKQIEQGMKEAFKDEGIELPDDYYRAFFKSRYATEQGVSALAQNLKTLSQARPSYAWWQGRQMTGEETKQTLFGGQQQNDLRSRLSRSFAVRSSFLAGEEEGPVTQSNAQNKLVQRI